MGADYVFGDLQACYDPLMRLLDKIQFNEQEDRLWFVGDLINRGPHSLEVLRFIKNLPLPARITLGNHDLYFLNQLFVPKPARRFKTSSQDTLQALLQAEDAEELGHWLRTAPLLYHDPSLNVVMSHAGIAPVWDLATAKLCAQEVEHALRGADFIDYLTHLYGNEPNYWSPTHAKEARLRVITNYLTRMRFCFADGSLSLDYQGTIQQAPDGLVPWFSVKNRLVIEPDILFGHWAALQGECPVPGIYALDTGCIWGGALTALRLQDRRRFAV